MSASLSSLVVHQIYTFKMCSKRIRAANSYREPFYAMQIDFKATVLLFRDFGCEDAMGLLVITL